MAVSFIYSRLLWCSVMHYQANLLNLSSHTTTTTTVTCVALNNLIISFSISRESSRMIWEAQNHNFSVSKTTLLDSPMKTTIHTNDLQEFNIDKCRHTYNLICSFSFRVVITWYFDDVWYWDEILSLSASLFDPHHYNSVRWNSLNW